MDELTIKEISRKYGGTTFSIYDKPNKQQLIVRLDEMIGQMFTGWSYREGKATPVELAIGDIEILPSPDTKVFDCGNNVFLFTHIPNRQWRIGLCNENSKVYSPLFEFISSQVDINKFRWLGSSFRPRGFEWYENLFISKEDKSLRHAIATMLADKAYARTLNDKWFVSVGKKPDEYLLWYFDLLIANVYLDKSLIVLLQKHFKQEVTDLVTRTGEHFYVQ